MTTRWKHNEKCEQPRYLCFLDIESYQIPNMPGNNVGYLQFKLGVAKFGLWNGSDFNAVHTVKFTNTAHFWRSLAEHCRAKTVQWVFGHNILFDLWQIGFPEMVQEGDFQLEISQHPSKDTGRAKRGRRDRKSGHCSLDSGSVFIKGIMANRRINFIDTFNYFRCGVREIGASINLPKLDMPGDDNTQDEWFTYCERDVDIIKEAMCGLLREWKLHDLGNWQPTIASLAFSSYRHRFMNRPIVAHNHEETTKYEAQSYYDGRTAAFYAGTVGYGQDSLYPEDTRFPKRNRGHITGPVTLYDVRSLYPSVMYGNEYPVEAVCDKDGIPIIFSPPDIGWFIRQLDNYLCVATCYLSTDRDWYPVKRPKEGRFNKWFTSNDPPPNWNCIPVQTIYPVGNIVTTLCTPEIKLALENGHLHHVSSCVLYHKFKIWDQWVDYWWKRKSNAESEGNHVRELVCKILLNSIAGKLAQKLKYWTNTSAYPVERPWYSWPAVSADDRRHIPLRSIGWQCQKQLVNGWANHALVACASHVNSYARVKMLHDRLALPDRSLLYLSNDGLLVTDEGKAAILSKLNTDASCVGSYKDKGTFQYAEFHGPRDYELDNEIKKAGLPADRELIGRRHWKTRTIENHQSMISRLPDGTVHTHYGEIKGSEYHWGMYDPGDGWLRPIRVAMWG